jgi:hypothetical protein
MGEQFDGRPAYIDFLQPIHYDWLIFRNLTIKDSLLSDGQMAREMVDLVSEKGI